MTSEEALKKALEQIGSMKQLADHIGVTKGAVSQWKLPGRRIPAEHCPLIERLTDGAVSCEELRPDVDWAYIRASGHHVERDGQRRAEERRGVDRRAD